MLRRLLSAVLACLITVSGFTAINVSAASDEENGISKSHKIGAVFAAAEVIELPEKIEYGSSEEGSGTGGSLSTSNNMSTYVQTVAAIKTNNKAIKSIGKTNYNFKIIPITPTLYVTMPSKLSVVINPYNIAVDTNEDPDMGTITSAIYTIRNKTKTNSVAIYADASLTVPKAKTGEPAIAVCGSPNEVKSKTVKSLSAYLLTSVSESSVTDASYEDKNLIETNEVKYVAGKTIVFADATINKTNVNSGTLMVVPRANYDGNSLKDYYYGHFRVGGIVSDNNTVVWSKSDKVTLKVVFKIVPCPDPT